jgi:dipeptidyl-peptidase-4
VAGAPVTDWHLYDTIWTERYLDTPEGNAEGYRLSSPVTYAENLEDALLIVHGTADDNVHPQNTLVMSQALIEAGKLFENAIYPRQKHGFRGKHLRHFYERMTQFFDRELAPPPPPKVEGEMKLE